MGGKKIKISFKYKTIEEKNILENEEKNISEYDIILKHFLNLFGPRYICKGCRKQSDCFENCLLSPEEYAEIDKERNKLCLKYLEYSKLSKEEQEKIIEIFELNRDSIPGKIKVMNSTFEELKNI